MNACDQLRLMVIATGGAAITSAINFATGNLPLGVVLALAAIFGLSQVQRLQQECQQLQQRT
jgi:hypothetical protein